VMQCRQWVFAEKRVEGLMEGSNKAKEANAGPGQAITPCG
jgi:hypothetical protein